MKYLSVLFLSFLLAVAPVAQENRDSTAVSDSTVIPADSVHETAALTRLAALMNLRPADIAFRDDYTEKDDYRLKRVADLMAEPLGMIAFAEEMRGIAGQRHPLAVADFAYANLCRENQTEDERRPTRMPIRTDFGGINTFYQSLEFNRLLMKIKNNLYDIIPAAVDSSFALLSTAEKDFLLYEYREIIIEDTADESKPVEVLDSIQEVEETYVRRFAAFGTALRMDFLLSAGVRATRDIYEDLIFLKDMIDNGRIVPDSLLADTNVTPDRPGLARYLGKHPRWAVGGSGPDHYAGDYHCIIDFGGDDRYDLEYDPDNPHPTVIIDFSGNDIYTALDDFALASGCLNVGLLFDFGGDDIYNGGMFSCGSGYFGLGLLCDDGGSDRYYGDIHVQGAGTFGIGLLIDRGGADVYSGALFAQGVGLTGGLGLLVDYIGNDNYTAGGKYGDVLRYDDHYLSLSQGFGYGLRPYLSGGIGAIVDFEGNDNYMADIFGQGSSYWWSLGLICDSSGHDQYLAHQYAQGAATHMTLGLLLDTDGNDFYRGKGLMQGCGHDYSCGLILDRRGDDIYHAYDLSQAAGSANGIGILIDSRGDDAYYVMKSHNTQGYGNPRRDFGSIGLFLDLAGEDRYDGNGADNGIWKTDSKWGGGMDWQFSLPDSAENEKR